MRSKVGPMWIIYIPRKQVEAELPGPDGMSLWEKANNWLAHKIPAKLKAEDILCTPAKLPEVTSDETVYLLPGITAPGETGAEWPHDRNRISFNQMADQIINAGLPPDFAGSLKVYCSHGAEGIDTSPSFVKRFADEMVRRGYAKCSIYGYLGKLTLDYVNSSSSDPAQRAQFATASALLDQGWHRYSMDATSGNYSRRAKDAKVRF